MTTAAPMDIYWPFDAHVDGDTRAAAEDGVARHETMDGSPERLLTRRPFPTGTFCTRTSTCRPR